MRDSAIVYQSYREAIKELPDKQRLHIWEAILDFAFDGKEPVLSGVEKAVFTLIKPQIIANNKRYENGKKGAEYGKQGGRPPKTKPQENPIDNGDETPRKPQNNPDQTPNVNVNDNVNVIESIYVNSNNACVRARMDPPSVDEVRDYCREIDSTIDAQRFVDYYTANGWMVGKNPMRDWKAMVRRWGTLQFSEDTNRTSKGITFERYTDEQLNSLFTLITEDDE